MKKFASLFGVMLAAILLLTGVEVQAATNWNTQTIQAVGMGVPPRNAVGAQARILARRAAIADAQRNLLEAVKEVQVDAETTVENVMVTSDIIRTRVSGSLQGARIVSTNYTSDGACEVTMEVGMFGVGGLAEAVIPQPQEIIPFPTPAPVEPNVTITIGTSGYTGVIIDCRGLGLNPVMSPVIKDAAGVKLYGHQNLDYDLVIRDGMADYANSNAQATRAGNNPLIIRAERLADHNANPVISVSDGNILLSANQQSGFLNRMAVVFLY